MQGQRETNASNTSLIDDIYDDIMLNEVKRKNTYDIKNYSIKLVKEEQEKEPPKEQGIFKNIFSKKDVYKRQQIKTIEIMETQMVI